MTETWTSTVGTHLLCGRFIALTVVDEADGGERLKTGARFSCNLLKAVGQPTEEILPLLVEAKPQVQLQLSLNGPACRTEALLTRQLRTDDSS